MVDNKRFFPYILFIVLFVEGCVSVNKYNSQINNLRNVKDLKSDVEYVEHKLEKLHPDLYHYIPKKDLEYKFDSLKSSLTAPMTSYDFYFKLSPVIASIRQGHTQTIPLIKKLKYHEKKIANSKGTSPLVQFDFELFDNKLYIVKNYSNDSSIKAGTEVLNINGVRPMDIIEKYSRTLTSDGYNTTFIPRRFGKGFSRYLYYEQGIQDSVVCLLNYKDTLRSITLKRPVKIKNSEDKKSKEQLVKDKDIDRKEKQKRKLLGYDPIKKIYSKQLIFPVKDSSIAIFKIMDFMKGNYTKFYKKSFQLLKSVHTKTIIIDLRDNGGGHIREINTLYSYLADTSFRLINKSQVVSKTSLWDFGYYNGKELWEKVIQTIFLPVVLEVDIFTYLKIRKGEDQKYYFALKESKLTHVKSNRFKGKVYVLINGGSFSASSLLSTNLKESGRAFFVGQETGGADNGCVAGIMPLRTLPASKLILRFGLLGCQTPYVSKMDGRGIFPDKEITPTLTDRLNGTDPELDWVLNDVKEKN